MFVYIYIGSVGGELKKGSFETTETKAFSLKGTLGQIENSSLIVIF